MSEKFMKNVLGVVLNNDMSSYERIKEQRKNSKELSNMKDEIKRLRTDLKELQDKVQRIVNGQITNTT